ncbi:flagellar hook capping FlgD N-terminal domain-containing protein [Motilibacter deserti]|uniref:Flagellar hook capping protein n=1 Tax=Motilibacter deserti TaxID=2714956 RepID=A0ABX0H2Y6_9ACTN|nr:flagellar hook capping FlgD N-terminal domain-containing protein [Motilibacter deserti]NHC16231.1 flagellar hook capping protein [Motilibacter deserti]
MPDPISGYTPISDVIGTQQPAAPTKKANDELDKDAFLKLLVAQLKYQDPNSPVDSSQFMSQTAQFTSVEKLTALADTQTAMLSSQQLLGASSLVGKTVSYPGPDGTDVSGVVTSAQLSTDGPVLRVGDVSVPLTSVKEVKNTPST